MSYTINDNLDASFLKNLREKQQGLPWKIDVSNNLELYKNISFDDFLKLKKNELFSLNECYFNEDDLEKIFLNAPFYIKINNKNSFFHTIIFHLILLNTINKYFTLLLKKEEERFITLGEKTYKLKTFMNQFQILFDLGNNSLNHLLIFNSLLILQELLPKLDENSKYNLIMESFIQDKENSLIAFPPKIRKNLICNIQRKVFNIALKHYCFPKTVDETLNNLQMTTQYLASFQSANLLYNHNTYIFLKEQTHLLSENIYFLNKLFFYKKTLLLNYNQHYYNLIRKNAYFVHLKINLSKSFNRDQYNNQLKQQKKSFLDNKKNIKEKKN